VARAKARLTDHTRGTGGGMVGTPQARATLTMREQGAAAGCANGDGYPAAACDAREEMTIGPGAMPDIRQRISGD
jgi:hypothetical protein